MIACIPNLFPHEINTYHYKEEFQRHNHFSGIYSVCVTNELLIAGVGLRKSKSLGVFSTSGIDRSTPRLHLSYT